LSPEYSRVLVKISDAYNDIIQNVLINYNTFKEKTDDYDLLTASIFLTNK